MSNVNLETLTQDIEKEIGRLRRCYFFVDTPGTIDSFSMPVLRVDNLQLEEFRGYRNRLGYKFFPTIPRLTERIESYFQSESLDSYVQLSRLDRIYHVNIIKTDQKRMKVEVSLLLVTTSLFVLSFGFLLTREIHPMELILLASLLVGIVYFYFRYYTPRQRRMRRLNRIAEEDSVSFKEAVRLLQDKQVLEKICPALQSLSTDSRDIAKFIVPALLGSKFMGLGSKVYVTLVFAWLCVIITRMGIATICAPLN